MGIENTAGFITVADVIISLTAPPIFLAPQKIEGFAEDRVFNVPSQTIAIMKRGVDGAVAAGFIFIKQPWSFTLLPSSPSCGVFDTVVQGQKALRTTVFWNGFVTAPSLGQSWIMTNGILVNYSPASDAGQVFENRVFGLEWQDVIPVPYVNPII